MESILNDIPRFVGSFKDFVKDCLGYKANKDHGYVDLTPEHDALVKFLQADTHRFKLIMMPRYSFKSEVITSSFALWNLVRNPNLRILIYSDSAGKANGFLETIKNHILGRAPNSSFRKYFPNWECDEKWTMSEIIVSERSVAYREPSIDTAGIETSKVGMHYDMIFFDDIVSDLNVTTKAQMDKVYDCYKKALSLLKPDGHVVVVGTRWHYGDAYGRMLFENTGEFGVFIRKAVVNDTYPFEAIGLTKEFLDQQRLKQGSYLFSCLYLLEPVDDESALFRYDHFSFYESVDHEKLFISCAVDPAGEGEDYTGITVVGTDRFLNLYILDVINKQLTPTQIIETVIRLNYKWGFNKFGVEKNLFRGMLEKEIKRAVEEEEKKSPKFKRFSMEEFQSTAKRGEGKHARIQALQPFHERGALKFRGRRVEELQGAHSELAYQMMQYPKAPHDDLVDSLSWQLLLSRPGGQAESSHVPPGSVAWAEQQEYKKIMQMNRHLPRGMRRKFELSLS